MRYYAIIVAGGKGRRMKKSVPKQFLLLAGKPILMYSIESFFRDNQETKIIVVLPSTEKSRWRKLCRDHSFHVPHVVVNGGLRRFDSVKNGLALVKKDGLVAVHDGVRPLLRQSLIRRTFRKAKRFGAAIPVIQVKDSVRIQEGKTNKTVSRNSVLLVQTPQCFRTRLLKKAYELKYRSSFTDDANVAEANSMKIYLVAGREENIKITTASDLIFAEALMKTEALGRRG
jgi:2-C-methyl-D-erythritol 4-phosphate cytidylyltransferase